MKARFLKFQDFNLDLAMSGSEETVQVAGPLVPRRDTFRMYGSCRCLLISKYTENSQIFNISRYGRAAVSVQRRVVRAHHQSRRRPGLQILPQLSLNDLATIEI